MRSAPERYDTVRAALRYTGDGSPIKAVRERFLRSEAGRRTFGGPPEPFEAAHHSEPDGPFGWRVRVWRVDQHRWRQELELPDGGLEIVASTGRLRSSGTPEGPPGASEMWERRVRGGSHQEDPGWLMGTDTFWTMYPFDPAGFCSLDGELGVWTLRPRLRWCGRDGRRRA